MKDEITYEDFLKVDIRIGTIIEVEDFPKARKSAYQLKIDFGDLGIRKSSAQITDLYSKKDLMNKQISAIINFKTRQIANFMSEVLVIGVYNIETVRSICPHYTGRDIRVYLKKTKREYPDLFKVAGWEYDTENILKHLKKNKQHVTVGESQKEYFDSL